MNKLMVRNMASILADLLNEADTVPTGVMDCIFGQFENYGTVSIRVKLKLIPRRQTGHRSSSSPTSATSARSSCSVRRSRTSRRSSFRTDATRVRATSRFSRHHTSSSSPSSATPRTSSWSPSLYWRRTSRQPRRCPSANCPQRHSVPCSGRGRRSVAATSRWRVPSPPPGASGSDEESTKLSPFVSPGSKRPRSFLRTGLSSARSLKVSHHSDEADTQGFLSTASKMQMSEYAPPFARLSDRLTMPLR